MPRTPSILDDSGRSFLMRMPRGLSNPSDNGTFESESHLLWTFSLKRSCSYLLQIPLFGGREYTMVRYFVSSPLLSASSPKSETWFRACETHEKVKRVSTTLLFVFNMRGDRYCVSPPVDTGTFQGFTQPHCCMREKKVSFLELVFYTGVLHRVKNNFPGFSLPLPFSRRCGVIRVFFPAQRAFPRLRKHVSWLLFPQQRLPPWYVILKICLPSTLGLIKEPELLENMYSKKAAEADKKVRGSRDVLSLR